MLALLDLRISDSSFAGFFGCGGANRGAGPDVASMKKQSVKTNCEAANGDAGSSRDYGAGSGMDAAQVKAKVDGVGNEEPEEEAAEEGELEEAEAAEAKAAESEAGEEADEVAQEYGLHMRIGLVPGSSRCQGSGGLRIATPPLLE